MGVANTNVSVTGVAVQYTSGTVGVCTAVSRAGRPQSHNGFNANSQVLYGFTVGGGVDVALTAKMSSCVPNSNSTSSTRPRTS